MSESGQLWRQPIGLTPTLLYRTGCARKFVADIISVYSMCVPVWFAVVIPRCSRYYYYYTRSFVCMYGNFDVKVVLACMRVLLRDGVTNFVTAVLKTRQTHRLNDALRTNGMGWVLDGACWTIHWQKTNFYKGATLGRVFRVMFNKVWFLKSLSNSVKGWVYHQVKHKKNEFCNFWKVMSSISRTRYALHTNCIYCDCSDHFS